MKTSISLSNSYKKLSLNTMCSLVKFEPVGSLSSAHTQGHVVASRPGYAIVTALSRGRVHRLPMSLQIVLAVCAFCYDRPAK